MSLIRFDGRLTSGLRPRKDDVHHGEHREKEAAPSPLVHAAVQAEIVELCRRVDRSVGQAAKDVDLTESAVRDWILQTKVGAGET
ncbi:hypothetical protein OG462_43685 [Streptomyces sp. NBC_01077]|uniref:hypothetical protein n=1 Tax=Streptomyces sp. NBC_01077 TaxID=2903746 RepID=UPI00386C60BA|nr:hypothetical protein OG462_01320 [Streptomyces sp. NBC_01077]WSV43661.1 hypothetical protein OG462_43685 [Streptomyces sp. NBC_01077]